MNEPQTSKTETEAQTKPEPKVETKTSQRTISQEEFDALSRKASNYDLIESDPELAPKVLDHFKAKTANVGRQTQQRQTTQENTSQQDDRMNQALMQQQREIAKMQIRMFEQTHPDMNEYRDEMAKLANRHPTMDLEELYNFSKAAKSQASQKSASPKPATATAETNDSAGDVEADTDTSELLKKINDPKATPRLDDVIGLAWQAAKKKHQGQ